jgi:VWFA-related protein
MKARFTLAFAVWCSYAFAQLPQPQAPKPIFEEPSGKHRQEEPSATVQVDAVVTDAGGRPVTGLTAGDFEVLQGDKPQKISGATYVDGSRGRTLVFVIDDLELPSDGLSAIRGAVRDFLENRLRPVDRVAILATSKGSASQQQLSADPIFLLRSLDAIQLVGPARGGATPEGAARGALCQLRMVIENLRKEPGRKSVVFFSGGLRSASIGKSALPRGFAELLDAAGRSSVVLYEVDPHAPVAEPSGEPADARPAVPLKFATRSLLELQNGLPDVARRTGGLLFETSHPGTALDRIAQDADGYYQLAYEENELQFEFANSGQNAEVRVKRPGLSVRSGSAARFDEVPYVETYERLSRDQAIPFSSEALSLRLTPVFEHQPQGSSVEAMLHLDLHGVTMTENLKGVRESQVQMAVATIGPNAETSDQTSSTLMVKLSVEDYEAAVRNGLSFSMRLPLRRTTPGGWQLWVVARDEATGRVGSASEFIEIPDLSRGWPVLSGLTLEGLNARKAGAGEIVPPGDESASMRIFRPGTTLRYNYIVYNLASDKDKRSRVEVRLRLYRHGEQVYGGSPMPLEFPPSDSPRQRSASGTMTLGATMPAGRYSFELSVRDTLAPPGKPTTAIQYADFEVKP